MKEHRGERSKPIKTQAKADGDIRRNRSLRGRDAYEASLHVRPFYHDGTPRKSWSELPEYARNSW